jgi:hypothetical protein
MKMTVCTYVYVYVQLTLHAENCASITKIIR